MVENKDLSCPQAATATADAKKPAKYLTTISWWKYGNSLSQFRSSALISNSFDILSLSRSRDLILRQNLYCMRWICDCNVSTKQWWRYYCNIAKAYSILCAWISSHQLLSPAPRPGTNISTTASTIVSTIAAGFTCLERYVICIHLLLEKVAIEITFEAHFKLCTWL